MTTLTKSQRIEMPWKTYKEGIATFRIKAEVRYDDECNNGHNSFSITGTIKLMVTTRKNFVGWEDYSGGCLHDQIAEHFPELAPFIKWHLCSSDGPMHYVANTVFHVSDLDHNGFAAGEASRFEHGVRFNNVPVTHRLPEKFLKFVRERMDADKAFQVETEFQVVAIAHSQGKPSDSVFAPHYTFVGFGEKWHECPFRDKESAEQFCQAFNTCKVEFTKEPVEYSKGKPRDLAAARSCAVWPEATDAQLTDPGLRERLLERLPALLDEFQKAMESLGFTY